MTSVDLQPIRLKTLNEFTKKQKVTLEEYSEKAQGVFQDFARKYTEYTHSGSQKIIQENQNAAEDEIKLIDASFRIFTQKRGEVKHSQKVCYSMARLLYYKNLRKRAFNFLQRHQKYKVYIRRMIKYTKVYYESRVPLKLFGRWKELTRTQIRSNVQQQVNRRTDMEIQKMHREYEQMIAQLEQVLEKKLVELKNEEIQHKELVTRYEDVGEKRSLAQTKF